MKAIAPLTVNLAKQFLDNQAAVSLQLSVPTITDPNAPIPPGAVTIGDFKATAGGDGTVTFGGGQTGGKVTFSGHAGASFSMGVFLDAVDAVKAISPAPELAEGLNVNDATPSRYLLVRAAYDATATAKGSVALGTGASATFGVTGSSSGLFALLHRFSDSELALKVFTDTFDSWALPSQMHFGGAWSVDERTGKDHVHR